MLSEDRIYLSTAFSRRKSVRAILEQVAEHLDCRRVELSGGTDREKNLDGTLRDFKKRHGFEFLIHNYFPPPKNDFVLNVTSPDRENRRRSLEFARRSIDLAETIGADFYTLHAGYRALYRVPTDGGYFSLADDSEISVSEARENFKTSMIELLQYADTKNISIGFENLFPVDGHPVPLICTLADIEWGLEVLSEFSNSGFLLDLGHLKVASNQLGFDPETVLEALEPQAANQLLEVHVSANNGKTDQHNALSENDWVLSALRQFDFTGVPVTLEARGLNLETARSNLNLLREIAV
ncbi:MAG: sugar phosphate isomerase/epimerase family protein [bacterium]